MQIARVPKINVIHLNSQKSIESNIQLQYRFRYCFELTHHECAQ